MTYHEEAFAVLEAMVSRIEHRIPHYRCAAPWPCQNPVDYPATTCHDCAMLINEQAIRAMIAQNDGAL